MFLSISLVASLVKIGLRYDALGTQSRMALWTAGRGHPTPSFTPITPLQYTHTNKTNCSIINTHFSQFQLERNNSSVTDGRLDQQTNGPTDQRTDKASYRVACPQLKRKKQRIRKRNGRKRKRKGIKGIRESRG